MGIPYTAIVLHGMIFGIFVSVFWKAGQMEDAGSNRVAWLWMGMSLAVFAVTWWWLDFGYVMLVVCQVGLGVAIGVARAVPGFLHGKES